MDKRFWILMLLSFMILFSPAAWAVAPKVVVENDTFDFGRIYKGEKVAHAFTFRNEGDAPLNVKKVRSSCGCTAAIVSERVIPPGGGGELKATFDSDRFQGQISKTVYLYIDDPLQGVVQFHIKGFVKEEISISPPLLDFGLLDPSSSREAVILLTNDGDSTIEFPEIRSTMKGLETKIVPPQIGPGESAQLQVVFEIPEQSGSIGGYILLKTAGARVKELRIPVSGSVRPSTAK